MKLRILIVVTLISLLFSLVGCNASDGDALYAAGSYAVPGMYCSDLKGQDFSTDTMEIDSYGRVLFTYEGMNVITNQREKAVVICQKYDSKTIYLYENIAYLRGEYTSQDLDELKRVNDWNCPLNLDKCIARHYSVSLDRVMSFETSLEFNSVYSAVCEQFQVERSVNHCILDVSSSGSELYWFVIPNGELEESYFVISDSDYNLQYVKIENVDDYESTLVTFKKEIGW